MRRIALVLVLSTAALPVEAQIDEATRAGIDSLFSSLDRSNAPGCAVGVARAGDLVFERGYGMGNLDHRIPLDGSSVFYLASVSKQFTAAAVLVAEHEGILSRDDLVREHIPEFPDYGEPVTIRHLVHHTSGVRDYLTLMWLAGTPLENVLSDDDMLGLIHRQKELNFPPGSEYLYSNSGYVLLAEIVRRATGRSLREYADEKIFRPLAMVDTHFHDDRHHVVARRVFSYDPGEAGDWRTNYLMNFDKVGDGGLYSTVRDLARWDAAFYEDRLGVPGFADAMYERGVLKSGDTIAYAAGLAVDEWRGVRRVEHSGGLMAFRTQITRYPDERMTTILLCNTGALPPRMGPRLAEALLPELAPEPPAAQSSNPSSGETTEDSPEAAPPEFDLAPLAGDYYSEELGSTWTMRVAEGLLVIHHPGGDVVELATEDGVTFGAGGVELTFDRPQGFLLQAGRVKNLRFTRLR
jgi:CubicO group peptidase (beta-lactamase class C family)